MIYVWNCTKCGEETETTRKMVDIEVGPDTACKCGNGEFKRKNGAGSKLGPWRCFGSHDDEYHSTGRREGI